MTTTSAAQLTPVPADDSASIEAVVGRLRATFRSGRTRPLEWRKAQLAGLERMLSERESDFVEALSADLGRRAVDSWLADLAPVSAESAYARKRLSRWNRRRHVRTPLAGQPARSWYQYEPLGVVLIIGPWNYPVQLVLAPLIGALAAGNCAIIKPSEHTPTVSALLAKLLPQYVDKDAVAVVEGQASATQGLIDQALDHIFFTGGPEIGKAVMAGAAKHLTPVTLELGGKSPVIVNEDAVLKVAARRIAFSKLINSGQTCVAPDYVLVHRSVRDEFVAELDKAITALTAGEDPQLPIVNTRQAGRLAGLLEGTGGDVVRAGSVEVENHTAALTIVVDPDPTSDLMNQEIFGPILPIVTIDDLDQAIKMVNDGPKPLAVYLFSSSRKAERRVLDEISNGGTVINHLMFQVLVTPLPFGGVGNSGMGAYHGVWGFETFSHRKAVVRKPARPDPSFVYPPYTAAKEKLMRMVF